MRLFRFVQIAGLVSAVSSFAMASDSRPWDDTKLSPARRAELLDGQLTDAERLSLLHGDFPLLMPQRPADMPLAAGYFPGVPRLGVPPLIESDASLGVANARRENDDATPLPSGLALAATWSPELAYDGGSMIGKQARQKGFDILLAGGVNLVRDPRNGRNFEYVGEDPLLAGTIAGQSILGIQSNHIVSTIKHFVLNGQESGRHGLNAVIDPSALRESDLLAFQLAVEIGQPGSAMCAYNKINGAYACENPETLKALKEDWGWRGWVMSDWGAVHSTVSAAMAGLDQESGEQIDREVYFGEPLKTAGETGQIPPARLHDMARRVLWGLFSTGLMDHPPQSGGLDTAADAKVSGRAADQGIVLLKNRSDLLPLAAEARSIAVIGGHADVGVMSGGGSSQVIPRGSLIFPAPKDAPSWGQGEIFHPNAPLAAIKAHAAKTSVTYSDGNDIAAAAASASRADVAIVFATQWATEGMDASLTLPDRQDELIRAVAAANRRTIVVLETGGPVLMPWLDAVPAVIEAWYPGARGGDSIARVLFGEIDPSGRLPVTFPRGETQLPRPLLPGADIGPETLDFKTEPLHFDVVYSEGADVGYRWYEKQKLSPLFPFGHGLSYTRFRYDRISVQGGAGLVVAFDITNTGKRAGFDTPQVYAGGDGQTNRLVGWRKVWLAPGETRHLEIRADPRLLARFDVAQHGWNLAAGRYRVAVAKAAGAPVLTGEAALDAARIAP